MNPDKKADIETYMELIAGLERENKIQSRLIAVQTDMIKSLEEHNAELKAFKSGDKYVRMEKTHIKEVSALEQQIAVLKKELADSRSHVVTIRNQWFEIFEQVRKECDRKLAEAQKALERMEKRALKAERQRDDALAKVTKQRHELYEVKTELEDEKEKNRKLTAQINRDYENSSIPSSKSVNHKKVTNSREKSGRKPGGQPGHKGHGRKKQEPTRAPVKLPPPPEVPDDPDLKKLQRPSQSR